MHNAKCTIKKIKENMFLYKVKLFIVFAIAILVVIPRISPAIQAQLTNEHAGVVVGESSGLGFHGGEYGAAVGFDDRKGSWLMSGDVQLVKVCKNVGGCGYQFDGRGSVARFLTKNFAVQGGFNEGYYKVKLFGKSAFQPFAGVRYATNNFSVEGNYRKDITSPNKENIAELRITGYLQHHLFVRFAAQVNKFTYAGKANSGTAATFTAGFYK